MPPPTWQCGCSAPGRLDHLRGLSASGLHPGQCLLAAADAYQTYLEPRPQRPALPAGTAAARLRPEVSAGRLAEAAVESVLVAAGQQEARRRILPSALTARDVEVLRLLCRGLDNRAIAVALFIAPKTARNHVEHIYEKTGVSNRVSAV
ncbi:LuxR C-terminal-related transcriptional regulator [Arthrobacter alpinus]|nr:LuxR C-terminal-related transcriptional regulator [Arthrobacter alpinus]